MSVLPKIWRALFSCCLRFEICPFSLLTTILVFKLELFCLALICSKLFDFDKVVADFTLFNTLNLHLSIWFKGSSQS